RPPNLSYQTKSGWLLGGDNIKGSLMPEAEPAPIGCPLKVMKTYLVCRCLDESYLRHRVPIHAADPQFDSGERHHAEIPLQLAERAGVRDMGCESQLPGQSITAG